MKIKNIIYIAMLFIGLISLAVLYFTRPNEIGISKINNNRYDDNKNAENKLRFDEPVDREGKIKFERSRDLEAMWKLAQINGYASNGNDNIISVAPTSAINAAKRVMAELENELKGKTIEEAFGILKRPKLDRNYNYNFPFVEGKGIFMMRFDNGHFGYEYFAELDADKKIIGINEQGIW